MGARRLGARWAFVVVLAVAAACTGDDESSATAPEDTAPEDTAPAGTEPAPPDEDLREFCDAYDAFVEASQAGLAVDEARVVADLAPPGTEEHLDLLAVVLEAGAGSDPDGDLTGDLDYMELVVAMREPGPRQAQARLYEILEEDCGRDVGTVIG